MSAAGHNKRSLKQVGIFAAVSPETLHKFESRCRWCRYHPDKEIIPFNGTATEVYFLTEGRAQVIVHSPTGKDVMYRTIEPGEIFGEFAAIDGEPRSASVEVIKPSTVASMTSWDFRNAILDEPEIAMALLRQLTGECRRLSRRVLEFSSFAVRNRVQAELLRLAGGRDALSENAAIRPAPTHAAIASRISTHREAVTRELNRLTQLGVLERPGGDLLIKDVTRLANMVQEATDG
jgi:CRP/FNR family transcriptional regulator, cyclic AMP receptor protein